MIFHSQNITYLGKRKWEKLNFIEELVDARIFTQTIFQTVQNCEVGITVPSLHMGPWGSGSSPSSLLKAELIGGWPGFCLGFKFSPSRSYNWKGRGDERKAEELACSGGLRRDWRGEQDTAVGGQVDVNAQSHFYLSNGCEGSCSEVLSMLSGSHKMMGSLTLVSPCWILGIGERINFLGLLQQITTNLT